MILSRRLQFSCSSILDLVQTREACQAVDVLLYQDYLYDLFLARLHLVNDLAVHDPFDNACTHRGEAASGVGGSVYHQRRTQARQYVSNVTDQAKRPSVVNVCDPQGQ